MHVATSRLYATGTESPTAFIWDRCRVGRLGPLLASTESTQSSCQKTVPLGKIGCVLADVELFLMNTDDTCILRFYWHSEGKVLMTTHGGLMRTSSS